MSGAKDPSTRAEATSGPRARPVRRTAGSTAAAWLSVKGMTLLLVLGVGTVCVTCAGTWGSGEFRAAVRAVCRELT
ncbi:hypothetical protein Sros01_25150 [Streptomyces roseochromogenus]|nr:hypothetical protein Sros01_25150 [Streptomyces roseochromogenus]